MSTEANAHYTSQFSICKDSLEIGTIYVNYRPYLCEFLEYISKNYEIIVFCNGSPICCDQVIDEIEYSKQYFSKRLYDNEVIFENPSFNVKNYTFLISNGRSIENTIIVDACVETFSLHQFSGVPITKYSKVDPNDTELVKLAKYLDLLTSCNDIHFTIKTLVETALNK